MQPEGGWHVIPKKICTYEEWLNEWRREARKIRSPVVVAQLALPGCLPTPMSCHSQGVHLTRQDDMTFRNRVSFCRCITAVQLQEIMKKSCQKQDECNIDAIREFFGALEVVIPTWFFGWSSHADIMLALCWQYCSDVFLQVRPQFRMSSCISFCLELLKVER